MSTNILFGLHENNTNRDFSKIESYGKNQFNSAFPVALTLFMEKLKYNPNYLCIKNGEETVQEITVPEIFGVKNTREAFYQFESTYNPYQDLISGGKFPGTDLVVCLQENTTKQTRALEIKLTALPDVTTAELHDSKQGFELVIRPDTLFYLVAGLYKNNTKIIQQELLHHNIDIKTLQERSGVMNNLQKITTILQNIVKNPKVNQTPLILQPVWKTKKLQPKLHENGFDVFVWSDLNLLNFMVKNTTTSKAFTGTESTELVDENSHENLVTNVDRFQRSLIWVFLSLHQLGLTGQINYSHIIDSHTYNTKNDKSFSVKGTKTREYIKSKNLETPRIPSSEVTKIIKPQGIEMLQPERRLDSVLYNSV